MARRLSEIPRGIAKQAYFGLLRISQTDERAVRRHGREEHVLILNLHSISPSSNPYWPSLHPDVFTGLLAWLCERTTVTVFRDLPRLADTPAPRPFVILSFDDGYKDFVEYAMPILDDFGVSANQNVIGEGVETGTPPWEIRILDMLNAAPGSLVRSLRVPGLDASPGGDGPAPKDRFGAALTNHLKRLPPRDRAPLLASVEQTMEEVEVTQPMRMMSTADVREAAAAGHEIGAHSYSHESMAFVDDDGFLGDLARCREVLARAGCECRIYAFPNGSYRQQQLRLLDRAGIEHALLVGESYSSAAARVHARITLRGNSVAESRARAVGLAP